MGFSLVGAQYYNMNNNNNIVESFSVIDISINSEIVLLKTHSLVCDL